PSTLTERSAAGSPTICQGSLRYWVSTTCTQGSAKGVVGQAWSASKIALEADAWPAADSLGCMTAGVGLSQVPVASTLTEAAAKTELAGALSRCLPGSTATVLDLAGRDTPSIRRPWAGPLIAIRAAFSATRQAG